MSDNWTSGLKNMKQALNNAHAIAVCGLGGISLENQHAAFRLMRMLGAYGYVERTLLPTLTRGSLVRHSLILAAGGEPNFQIPKTCRVLRDDRLLHADAWRNLRILQRGRWTAQTAEYEALYSDMVSAGGTVFLPWTNYIGCELHEELRAFRTAIELPNKLDWIQQTQTINLLGAYETALEEAGGASASFADGEAKADEAFALHALLQARSIDAALLIGQGEECAMRVLAAGVPLYVLGGEIPGAKISVMTAQLGVDDGGTILREDGIPVTVAPRENTSLPKFGDILKDWLTEAGVC